MAYKPRKRDRRRKPVPAPKPHKVFETIRRERLRASLTEFYNRVMSEDDPTVAGGIIRSYSG